MRRIDITEPNKNNARIDIVCKCLFWAWAVFTAVCILGGIACGGPVYPQGNRPEFLVKVVVEDSKFCDIGSGALISPTLILTAAHVVEESSRQNKLYVIFNDATWKKAVVLYEKREQDIAILRIDPVFVPSARIRLAPLRLQESVTVCGYPRGLRYGESFGAVTEWTLKGGLRSFGVSNESISGMSGGPVLDADGHIVGLLWGSSDNRSACVGQAAIKKFLDSLDNTGKGGILLIEEKTNE